MTIVETVLVFVGIPLLCFALVTLAIVGPSAMRQQKRYRPTKGWQYEPVWFLPQGAGSTVKAIEGAAGAPSTLGGASGEW